MRNLGPQRPSRTGRLPANLRGSRLFTGILVLLLDGLPLGAQTLRDEGYLTRARIGFDHIYELEYDLALETFSRLAQEYPEHPGPPLDLAATLWMRELFERQDLDLNKFLAPGYFTRPTSRSMPKEDRQAFFHHIDRSQKLATAILEKAPRHKDARYFLASAEGVLGAFYITIDHARGRAFGRGRKAARFHRELIEEDAQYYDSYMSVGLYEYVVDNLPWYIKWIALIAGYRGSEERAFEYLVRSTHQGSFVADDARVLLMALYVREKHYRYALEVARDLHRRYPRNFLLHLNVAQILEIMGETDQSVEAYLEVLSLAEESKPNYHKLPLSTFRYTLGERLMQLGRLELALEQLTSSINHPKTPDRERALSHLLAGQILDLLGKRSAAVIHYRRVEELADIEGSHRKARRYLKRPYQG